jgi:hypothetical protein
LKSPEVHRLVEEIVGLTGESKTEAVRLALVERRMRLVRRGGLMPRGARIAEFLRCEVWPLLRSDADVEGAGAGRAGETDLSISEQVSMKVRELGLGPEGLW